MNPRQAKAIAARVTDALDLDPPLKASLVMRIAKPRGNGAVPLLYPYPEELHAPIESRILQEADARANWVSAPVLYDWRQECWQILLATGADPDGDDAGHLNPGEALRAVRELLHEANLNDERERLEAEAIPEADRG